MAGVFQAACRLSLFAYLKLFTLSLHSIIMAIIIDSSASRGLSYWDNHQQLNRRIFEMPE